MRTSCSPIVSTGFLYLEYHLDDCETTFRSISGRGPTKNPNHHSKSPGFVLASRLGVEARVTHRTGSTTIAVLAALN